MTDIAGTFRVHVAKDYIGFASAHFITFAGHRCESLHGHNYRVAIGFEGTLDPESWYVFDFVSLKNRFRCEFAASGNPSRTKMGWFWWRTPTALTDNWKFTLMG